ncbi:MAG: TonB-dependent receptor [Bacteroidota bacterium]
MKKLNGLAPLLLLSMLFLFASADASAQTLLTQTIKGTIVDGASEEPVVAANILLLHTDPVLGAATEYDGSFRIENVPVGRYTVRISCLGYDEAYINELEVGAGKEVVLNLKLQESLVKLEDVVVTGKRLDGTPNNDLASVSARSFSVEQTKRYAAAINDPARMALSFAGVSTNDDESNEIVIRGNSPRGLLWRMEGVEIPNPNHFAEQGASGGGISALSVNVLANSDFLVSAFPAEYGNALSGVFDLKLRNGNNEKREYAIQAGVMGLDAAAEGPIGPKGGASYLLNYRYSTLTLLEGLGLLNISDGVVTFQDAAFKVHVPTKNNGYLSVWGMGGLSSENTDTPFDDFRYFSNRGVVGLNYRTYFKKNDYLETILSYGIGSVGDDYLNKLNNYTDFEEFTERALRVSLLYNRKINARNTFRAGVIGSRLDYDFLEWYKLPEEAERVTEVLEDGNTETVQAYAQLKHRFGTRLNVNVGLHATHLAIGDQTTIEPRVGMRWNYRDGHVISAGAGLHSRMDPLPIYFARVIAADGTFSQANRNLELPKAAHAVLGYEWRFQPEWRFQTEVYYQHLYDVPIASPGVQGDFGGSISAINFNSGYVTDSLFSDGTGRNYGLEMTVERFFTGGWYALSTVSLYQSKYTARDGIERNTRYNGNYVANVLAGKEWVVGKRQVNKIGVNIRYSLAGGNRQAPIDLGASRNSGFTVRDYSRAFEEQLPFYMRADVRLSYRINGKRGTTSVISLDVQNVTNRRNIWRTFYSANTNNIFEVTQLGLIPILNYRLEF